MIEISLENFNNESLFKANGNFAVHSKNEEIEAVGLNLQQNILTDLNQFEQKLENFENLEFAFIIQNQRTKTITFATDFFASKPLFYAYESHKLYIHSDFKSLKERLGKVSINNNYLRNYFNVASNTLLGFEETIYTEIFRVLPANLITFTNGKFEKKCYWKPNLNSDILDYTDEAKTKLFAKKIAESVKNKLHADKNAGANLSGGLDSSTIVGLISQEGIKLNTYYWDTATAKTEERKFANIVVKKWGTNHAEIKLNYDQVFEQLENITRITAQPETGLFPPVLSLIMAEQASKEGIDVIYTGLGGDNIVGTGYEYIDEIIAKEDWKKLKKNLKLLSFERLKRNYPNSYTKNSYHNAVLEFLLPQIKKNFQRKAFLKSKELLFSLVFVFKIPIMTLLEVMYKRIRNTNGKPLEIPKILKNIGNEAHKIDQRLIPKLEITNKFIQKHFESCLIWASTRSNEILTAIFFREDILLSNPFFNKNLLEYSVMIPAKYRFNEGQLRGPLRLAMNEILPKKISMRGVKAEASEVAYLSAQNLLTNFEKNRNDFIHTWDFIDKEGFEQIKKIFLDKTIPLQKKRIHIWYLIKIISFGIWLKQNANQLY